MHSVATDRSLLRPPPAACPPYLPRTRQPRARRARQVRCGAVPASPVERFQVPLLSDAGLSSGCHTSPPWGRGGWKPMIDRNPGVEDCARLECYGYLVVVTEFRRGQCGSAHDVDRRAGEGARGRGTTLGLTRG